MKILIVDDTHRKVEIVSQALRALQLTFPLNIEHETNAQSARKRLRQEDFDLLLIDLQLPDVLGVAPSQLGGVNFFDALLLDTKVNLPAEIMFITSEGGLAQIGEADAHRRGCPFCVVSEQSVQWQQILAGKIRLTACRVRSRAEYYDIAVITALRSELDAVLRLPYGWEHFRLEDDPTLYYRGHVNADGNDCTVVAASALRKGMAASAALATKLVLKFRPQILAMTGICAGVADKTSLGDVIVGNPTWDWGSGKHGENDDGSAVFKLSPQQSPLNMGLASLCDEISRDESFGRRVRGNWQGEFPEGEFRCHVGPMASGASVIASASIAEEIAEQNRDLIGIEMEAFAVMVAADYANESKIKSIAIKSVCDYADKDKRDKWQNFAAYTSACFADELFRRYFFKN